MPIYAQSTKRNQTRNESKRKERKNFKFKIIFFLEFLSKLMFNRITTKLRRRKARERKIITAAIMHHI